MRKSRTSGRVFSKPSYHGNMMLVGIHGKKKNALKKVEDRKHRIDSSRIVKKGNKYRVFVHYK